MSFPSFFVCEKVNRDLVNPITSFLVFTLLSQQKALKWLNVDQFSIFGPKLIKIRLPTTFSRKSFSFDNRTFCSVIEVVCLVIEATRITSITEEIVRLSR